jgi:hypothetical protein
MEDIFGHVPGFAGVLGSGSKYGHDESRIRGTKGSGVEGGKRVRAVLESQRVFVSGEHRRRPVGMRTAIVFTAMGCLCAMAIVSAASQRRFAILQTEKDGRVLIATIDSSFRDKKAQAGFPWFLSISTKIANPTEEGFATDEEAAELNHWEDAIEQKYLNACHIRYVGRTTWNGTRQLLIYTDAVGCATTKLKKFAADSPKRPFTFDLKRDDNWENVGKYLENIERLHAEEPSE